MRTQTVVIGRIRGNGNSATPPHTNTACRPKAGKTREPIRSVRRSTGNQTYERDHLVADLLPLVRRMAYQMCGHLPPNVDVDDLIGTGVMGLLDAVRKFDPRKHVKLESYARHRIRGAILDGLRDLDAVSRDMRTKAKRAERVYRELEMKLGRPVRDEEMAAAMQVSLKKWYRTVHELQPVGVDWLRPMEPAEIKPTDEELVAEVKEDAIDLCYRREQRDILNQALLNLSERDRMMMSLYYEQELTMEEIGDRLGIDQSRVSQLHSAAVKQLQTRVKTTLARPLAPVAPVYQPPAA